MHSRRVSICRVDLNNVQLSKRGGRGRVTIDSKCVQLAIQMCWCAFCLFHLIADSGGACLADANSLRGRGHNCLLRE